MLTGAIGVLTWQAGAAGKGGRPAEGLFQQRLNALEQALRLGQRRKARDALAVGGKQEFGEVPFDALAAQQPGRAALQLVKQRMRFRAVNRYLGEQRKTDAVVETAEAGDLLRVARLLRAELVAGKAHHHQAAVAIVAPQIFQPAVLRGKAAFAGGVHHQIGARREVAQGFGFAL